MSSPITYLFVPGNRPERFNKALASGADRVIVDLEDAVAPADKTTAQKAISDWLPTLSLADLTKVVVRINDANSSWYASDLLWLNGLSLSTVMLPKCESALSVTQVASALKTPAQNSALNSASQMRCIIALIESAKGLAALSQICAAPELERIAFGSIDYALDLDLPSGNHASAALEYAACAIAVASKAAGLAKPIAGVTAALDTVQVASAMQHELGLGFGAKLCIHPMQISAVHDVAKPSATQIIWAQRVVAAWHEHGAAGAIQVDEEMVDKPVFLRAQKIIQSI